MVVSYKPAGHQNVLPYLVVRRLDRVLAFVTEAFGAEVLETISGPGDAIQHVEVRIRDSVVMMGDPGSDDDLVPAALYLYVEDVDAVYARAIAAGATSVMEPMDMVYGDRQGAVVDPCGNRWFPATHIEDVPSDEIQRRATASVASRRKRRRRPLAWGAAYSPAAATQ
ncbi:MAG: VOC family protein [Myxococcota bacterium]|nr:VOC family protein [Myxococcota bacterium]